MAANDVAPELVLTADLPETPSELVQAQHHALAEQRRFAVRQGRVLTLSGVSGQRGVAALHLILAEHAPTTAVTDSAVHLACGRCRPVDEPASQYPCSTARQAVLALEAMLP